MERAGFERAVERGTPNLVAASLGIPKCCCLGVILSGRMRAALAEDFTVLDDHTTHPRILTRLPLRLLREFQRTGHVEKILLSWLHPPFFVVCTPLLPEGDLRGWQIRRNV